MFLIQMAFGSVEPADRIVANDRVAVGLAVDGSMGNPAAGVGLLADPDGPDGPIPVGGDWIGGRSAFEGWAIEADGVNDGNFASSGSSAVDLTWDELGDGGMTWRHAAGATDRYDVETWVALAVGRTVVWVRLRIVPHAALDAVSVLRAINPDPDAWLTGSTRADLSVEGEVVTAESPEDGRSLALASAAGEGGWCDACTSPSGLATGDWSASSDARMGVRVPLGALDADLPVVVDFVYAFGDGAAEAALLARASLADADPDGDGVVDGDCAPWDDSVGTGLAEEPDGRDNDCDGAVDEGLPGEGDDPGAWVPDVGQGAEGEIVTTNTSPNKDRQMPVPPKAARTQIA